MVQSLNELKQDDDGYNIKFSCPPDKLYQGRMVPFHVQVVDANGIPINDPIGNGSDVTMKVDIYTYRKGEGKAVRLRAVRVDNLIPFIPDKDFRPDQKETLEGLSDQPAPEF